MKCHKALTLGSLGPAIVHLQMTFKIGSKWLQRSSNVCYGFVQKTSMAVLFRYSTMMCVVVMSFTNILCIGTYNFGVYIEMEILNFPWFID